MHCLILFREAVIMVQINKTLYSTGILLVIGFLTQQGYGNWIRSTDNNRKVFYDNVPQCECRCGTSRVSGRIKGGEVTSVLNYPWMVRLFYKNKHHCSGTLINDKYVLTAAQCLDDLKNEELKLANLTAAFGEQNYCKDTEDPKPEISKRILRVIFKNNLDRASPRDDIALLELDERIPFSEATRPICMPTDSNDQFESGNATTAGWTEGDKIVFEKPTCQLLELDAPIVNPSECGQQDAKKKICAGESNKILGRKGTCKGDRGGPLMRLTGDKKFEVIGITSEPTTRSHCGYPTIFTRVSNYLTWIKENTKDACECTI